jgi:hypothetical protein
MAKTFNADAFAQCVFVWEGREYRFRPASIRDLIDYYAGDLKPRLEEAGVDPNKVLELQKEAIRRHIPELADEALDGMPERVVLGLFIFVQHGRTPEELEKNFLGPFSV